MASLFEFDPYNYESVDLNDELFLTEVPLDLIKENIEDQFTNPLEHSKQDYIQPFITKYEFSVENGHDDDQPIYESIFEDFVYFLENLFEKNLQISFPTLNDLPNEDVLDLLHMSYRFFILGISRNFTVLLKNYVEEKKDKLISTLEKKNDITSLNYKLELDDEDDVLLLSNMDMVVETILLHIANKYDVDKFLKKCISNKLVLELDYVTSKYEDFSIVGNFVNDYVRIVFQDNDFIYKLESKLRNHILKKYAKKRKKITKK